MIWWILGIFLGSTFVAYTAFVFCSMAKRMSEQGVLPKDFRIVAYIWLPIGLLADFVLNHTRGCIEFREGPRKILFTQRVQHHIDHSSGWRLEKAKRWAVVFNFIDADHIKRT